MVHRGQLYETKDHEERYRTKVFVCGVADSMIWYVHLLSEWNLNAERPVWQKARISEFERKFNFTNNVIAKRAYWKKKATGDLIQITGIKDDGWKHVHIYYELNKIDIHYFLEYFMPANKQETLDAISRSLHMTKNTKKIKHRIEMQKYDINSPIVYE